MLDNFAEVSIRHRQFSVDYIFRVREDRLRAFYELLLADRRPGCDSPMPGVGWSAALGLTAIFVRIPDRFPLDDIVEFLRADVPPQDPLVSAAEIEGALARFAAAVDTNGRSKYSQLAGLV